MDEYPYGCHGVCARVRLGFCVVFTDPVGYLGEGKERANTILSLSDFSLHSRVVYGHFSLVSAIPFFPCLEENSVELISEMAAWLEKTWLASLYLAASYLMMLCVDLRERRKKLRR